MITVIMFNFVLSMALKFLLSPKGKDLANDRLVQVLERVYLCLQ